MKKISFPIIEKNFNYQSNELFNNSIISAKGEILQIQKELIPEQFLKIYNEKDYSYYPLEICNFILSQIDAKFNVINNEFPLYNYIHSSSENAKLTGLSIYTLNKLEEIFEEIKDVLYFYNYETSFLDINKQIVIGRNNLRVFMFFETLFLKKHLELLISYLYERNLEIEKGSYKEYLVNIDQKSNHWTVGNEDIIRCISHLDQAIIESKNPLSFKIVEYDNVHVLFSFILSIEIK